jgi:hypothetical protein
MRGSAGVGLGRFAVLLFLKVVNYEICLKILKY